MRLFILSLLVSWTLSLTTLPIATAEPFSSPFAKYGVVDPRISAYMPTFDKNFNPRHRRHGYYLFPYSGYYRDNSNDRSRTSRPPKTVYKEPFVLDPKIFDPAPKTPLTIIIEDGVIVEKYRGY